MTDMDDAERERRRKLADDPTVIFVTSKRVRRSFVAFGLIIVLGLGWNAMNSRTNRQLAQDGKDAKAALCVYRAGLERRAQESRDFLSDPPKYIAVLHVRVTPAVIASVQADLLNREAAIRSIPIFQCPKLPPVTTEGLKTTSTNAGTVTAAITNPSPPAPGDPKP